MSGRAIGLASILVPAALIWLGYDQIDQLRGTLFWPYRYLLLALAAFLLLTGVQRLETFVMPKQQD